MPRIPIVPSRPLLPDYPRTSQDLLQWAQKFSVASSDAHGVSAARHEILTQTGTTAQRPAAKGLRNFYWDTTLAQLFYDNGAWVLVGPRDTLAHLAGTQTGSSTGIGATGTVSFAAESTDLSGRARLDVLGAAPSSSGILTLTFAAAFAAARPVGMFMPVNDGISWQVAAGTNCNGGTASTTQITVAWYNNGVALVAGNSYHIAYMVDAQ